MSRFPYLLTVDAKECTKGDAGLEESIQSKKLTMSLAVEGKHKRPTLQRWCQGVVVTPLVTAIVNIVSVRMIVKAVVMVLVIVIVRACVHGVAVVVTPLIITIIIVGMKG